MKLSPPIPNFSLVNNVSQYFGVNRSYYGEKFGLPGHNGLDVVVMDDKLGYGSPILAMHDFDSANFETDFPTKKRGTGLWLKKKLETPKIIRGKEAHYLETVYWHLADFSIKPGESGKAGDVVGLMGNTGEVYPKPSNDCERCQWFGCYDKETEVLTDSGWKFFAEITGTEKICTLNPATKEIEYQLPTG